MHKMLTAESIFLDFLNKDANMNVRALEADSIRFACSAVEYDQRGYVDEAIFFYKEAYQALAHAAAGGSTLDCYGKAQEYSQRITVLLEMKTSYYQGNQNPQITSHTEQNKRTAKFMIDQALEKDEAGDLEEAKETYVDAAGFCLKTAKHAGVDDSTAKQLLEMAKYCIERSETLEKKLAKKDQTKATSSSAASSDPLALLAQLDALKPFNTDAGPSQSNKTTDTQDKIVPKIQVEEEEDPHHVNQSPDVPKSKSSASLTKDEIDVLRLTSIINGKEFLPFINADVRDNFHFRTGFTDKHGLLELSAKQKNKLRSWKRPHEFMSDPKMIILISSFSIKQTLVSDCSFVASLAISAAYERRFNKKLITKIIYPQNSKGEPIYNPCGRYIVKLHFNGCFRKVVIDDQLPVDSSNSLLCSYSSNKNELWVSLIEKAYMKVMGGYDFPGSTSNFDLHALTGWIPERQSLREKNFDFDMFFEKLKSSLHNGKCLATISVGDIPEAEADRAGLVPTHAYAVLDVRHVHGVRLLQVKNPWSHLRWKGNYSAHDEKNWTAELLNTLQYDIKMAREHDNGVFWIDWASALHFFDVIYMNWNPKIFQHSKCYHAAWLANEGPAKETYSLANNPQYRLEITTQMKTVVWILLSRHITDKEDFAQNKEFISLLVYKNNGKKVYYPYDPPPYIDGIRINSPHYLCKIEINDPGTHVYTLVVSQYEKHKNIHFTIRTYCPLPVKMQRIPEYFTKRKRVQGEWNGVSAGGCENNRETYKNNPCYQIKLKAIAETSCYLLVELRAPRKYSSGFDIYCVETNADKPFSKTTSGTFRTGYSMMELKLPTGVYNIVPCTFQANKDGAFFLDVATNLPSLEINRIK